MKGWEVKALGEICQMRPPKSEARARLEGSDEVSFLPMEDLYANRMYTSGGQLRKLSDVVGSYTYFAEGDVLLAKITPCFENGKLGITKNLKNGIGFGSSEYFVLRPSSSVLSQWLYYFLLQEDFRTVGATKMTGAVGHKRVPQEYIATRVIPIPPLAEQQRIIGVLDEAFAGIATTKANTEKNIQNARAVFASHLESIFAQPGTTWEKKPLAELCEPSRVITYGVIKLGEETANGVPCLRTSNVRWLRIEIEGMKRIAAKLSSEYSRTVLKGGEVLVNVRGTLGGVAVSSRDMAGWNVSREVAVVPIDPRRINPEFVSYLIGSGTSQQWLGGKKKGAAYVGINIEDLRLLPVGFPSMEVQKAIVVHLKNLHEEGERLARLNEQKLAALDALKQSLLREAFSGRL